jgi:hypothetical protein
MYQAFSSSASAPAACISLPNSTQPLSEEPLRLATTGIARRDLSAGSVPGSRRACSGSRWPNGRWPAASPKDIRDDQKAVDHLLVVADIFFEQRMHDDGRRTGIFQMQHRVDVVAERRRGRHQRIFQRQAEIG